VPLLFSLLPPLSASVSLPDYPIIHIPYFRILLRSLLFPSDSLRGASRREPSSSSSSSSNEATRVWTVVGRNQIDAPEGTLPADVVELVTDEFWAKYDDIRWAFFREAT
jgi:U3 small nucleolar RNA-associated protein 19